MLVGGGGGDWTSTTLIHLDWQGSKHSTEKALLIFTLKLMITLTILSSPEMPLSTSE